jgi:predicted nucleic acid-binding protein
MVENKRIFVDSNYFVALFNSSDTLYPKALKIAKKIDEEGISLTISNLIFLEIVTVLSQKRGKRVAIEVGEYLLSNPKITLIHIDELLQEQTWNVFKQIKNKDISFVDCSIIAAMKSEGIDELLTFDVEDFKKFQKNHRFRLYPI